MLETIMEYSKTIIARGTIVNYVYTIPLNVTSHTVLSTHFEHG